LTGDQHNEHIQTGQRVIRHTSRPDVFYFFSHRTFLKTILASRTSGTFGFAPTHEAYASQNQKSHFLANAPIKNVLLRIDFMTS